METDSTNGQKFRFFKNNIGLKSKARGGKAVRRRWESLSSGVGGPEEEARDAVMMNSRRGGHYFDG